MTGTIKITQTHAPGHELAPGQAVVILGELSDHLSDGRLRIYEAARQQYLQPDGQFGDTAQLLEVESVFNDSATSEAYIVISETIAASIDPDAVVDIEVPAAGIKEAIYWPEISVGANLPPVPPPSNPKHPVQTGVSEVEPPVSPLQEETTPPPIQPPASTQTEPPVLPQPEPSATTQTERPAPTQPKPPASTQPNASRPAAPLKPTTWPIFAALLAGLAIGALAVWVNFPANGNGDVADANDQLNVLEAALMEAKQDAATARSALERAEAELSEAQMARDQVTSDLEDAKRRLENMQTQLGADENAVLDRAESANAERDQALRDLARERNEKEAAQAALDASTSRADLAEAENQRTNQDFQDATQRAQEAEEALAALQRDTENKSEELSNTQQALAAAERRAVTAERDAISARTEAQRLREQQGETESTRVRQAEEAAQRAEDRLLRVENELEDAKRRFETAEANNIQTIADRNSALDRAQAAERELAALQGSQSQGFDMEAQARVCAAPGAFAPNRTFLRSTTTSSLRVSDQRLVRALMCNQSVPCPEAFERVLGADFSDNASVVREACQF